MVPEPLGEVSAVSGPGSVETLQPFNVSVTDRQPVHQLVDTLQVWRQTAQLQQLNLGTHQDTFSVQVHLIKVNLMNLL